MNRKLIELPDPEVQAPFLALLPSIGKISELEKFSASFFAKLEKTQALRPAIGGELEPETARRINLEAEMLKLTLEWINGSKL